MFVYADHAATTKLSAAAMKAYAETAAKYYGNPSSLHSVGQEAQEMLTACREEIAGILGAEAREIYFTSGGSEADNQAIRSAAYAGARKGKKKIISTAIEHHAVLHTLKRLEREGYEIVLLPVGESGVVEAKAVEEALDENTALVTVMLANNEIGTIQPVAEIGAICKKQGVLFHTDAVQAVGHIPVNVKKIGCDYLALSAHKFGGPKGVGALYVRRGAPIFPLIEGGAQERGKRAGTEDLPAVAAMTAALKASVADMDATSAALQGLQHKLIDGLSKIPHCALNGDREMRLPGNVSFCFEGIEGESLLLLLDEKGICASSGSACTSGSLDPSHVLLAIGRVHDVAHGSLRLSLGAENTVAEVDYMLEAIPEVVNYLRNMSPVWRDLMAGKRQFIL
ncbi:MAG: cysteine desulfurase [Clostridia bacterium]|nr:cysteine desulfurase [Clostridia bacterium]